MAISVEGRSAGGAPRAGQAAPTLQRGILRLRNALWARTGARTASPPMLIRLSADGESATRGTRAWEELVDEAPQGAVLRIEGRGALDFPHLEAVLLAAERRGLETALVTGGVGLEERAPALYALGLSTLELQLYGTEEIHNAALGAGDAFERAVRGALSLKGLSCGAPRPRLVVEVPISAANQAKLVETVECAVAMGADKVVVMHSPPPGGNGGAADCDVVLGELGKIQSRWRARLVGVFPGLSEGEMRDFYGDGAMSAGPNRCLAPWRSVTVEPGGALRLCCGGPIGRIGEGPLAASFNSASARDIRRLLRNGFLPECEGCLGRFGGGLFT